MPKRDITIVRNSVESVYGFLDYLDRNVPGASKYTKYIKLEFVQGSRENWFAGSANHKVTVNVLYPEYKADIQHLHVIYECTLCVLQEYIERETNVVLEFSRVSPFSIDSPKTYKDLLDQAAQIVTTWMLYVDEVMDTE